MSRSIGDPDYKSYIPGAKVDAFFIWPEGHNQVHLLDELVYLMLLNCYYLILSCFMINNYNKL